MAIVACSIAAASHKEESSYRIQHMFPHRATCVPRKQLPFSACQQGCWKSIELMALVHSIERLEGRIVTVALANKMARIAWALLVKQENHRAPVAVRA